MLLPEEVLTDNREDTHQQGDGQTPVIVELDLRRGRILYKESSDDRGARSEYDDHTQNEDQHTSGEGHELTAQNGRLFIRRRQLTIAVEIESDPDKEDRQHERKKLIVESQVHETVYGLLTQNSGTGQEGLIDHRDVGKDGKKDSSPVRTRALPLDNHHMATGRRYQPGYKRCILNRTPRPIPSEGECFVSPVGTEKDGRQKREGGCKCPGQRRPDPVVILRLPERCNGKRKGNRHHREAEEDERRENHKPWTLEHSTNTDSTRRYKIGIGLDEGGIGHLLGNGPERGGTYRHPEDVPPKQHGDQKKLSQRHDKHDRLPVGVLRGSDQPETHEERGQDPDHEAPLLPSPECGEEVLCCKVRAGIVPDVEVLEPVRHDQRREQNSGCHHKKACSQPESVCHLLIER